MTERLLRYANVPFEIILDLTISKRDNLKNAALKMDFLKSY